MYIQMNFRIGEQEVIDVCPKGLISKATERGNFSEE